MGEAESVKSFSELIGFIRGFPEAIRRTQPAFQFSVPEPFSVFRVFDGLQLTRGAPTDLASARNTGILVIPDAAIAKFPTPSLAFSYFLDKARVQAESESAPAS